VIFFEDFMNQTIGNQTIRPKGKISLPMLGLGTLCTFFARFSEGLSISYRRGGWGLLYQILYLSFGKYLICTPDFTRFHAKSQ
jgi:hypothetical protein